VTAEYLKEAGKGMLIGSSPHKPHASETLSFKVTELNLDSYSQFIAFAILMLIGKPATARSEIT